MLYPKNLTHPPKNIVELLNAIPYIVEKPNIAIQIGIMSPPPPMPPLFARPSKIGKIKIPIISEPVGGKTSL
jgi:hypothetical protein